MDNGDGVILEERERSERKRELLESRLGTVEIAIAHYTACLMNLKVEKERLEKALSEIESGQLSFL